MAREILEWVNTRVTPYKKLRDIRVVADGSAMTLPVPQLGGEAGADNDETQASIVLRFAQRLPERAAPAGLDLDRAVLDELTAEHPTALGSPRQRARFLCGLSSPATTKAKLSRHALFGALAEQRFADVLALT